MRRTVVPVFPLLVGLLLAGCGVPTDKAARPISQDVVPLRNVERSPQEVPGGTARALVYLVQDGSLVAVTRKVPTPAGPADVLRALVAGPSSAESDAGLLTAVPPDLRLAVGSRTTGVVSVEVPENLTADAGRSDEVLAYAQVVVTLCSLSSVGAVRFLRGGQPLTVPRADGSLASAPVGRRDYLALL